MRIIKLIIILFLILHLIGCNKINKNHTNNIENHPKNENVIYLGLSFKQADLILKSYNIHPLAYCFGYDPELTSETYQLPTGKCLYLYWKKSETGFVISDIAVSTKIYPLMVDKTDPKIDAFWDSFKNVKSFNLKEMK